MKRGSFVIKLCFGLMGVIYAVVGGALLILAVKAAGSLTRIFTLPGDDLVFAVNGTLFTVLGVVFLLVTLILALADKRRAQMREELLAWGSRVKGEIVDVRTDYTIRVNRRSPLIASVRCDFPQGEVILRSRRLWSSRPAVGDTVEVIYDPMDEKRYVIEFPEEK